MAQKHSDDITPTRRIILQLIGEPIELTDEQLQEKNLGVGRPSVVRTKWGNLQASLAI